MDENGEVPFRISDGLLAYKNEEKPLEFISNRGTDLRKLGVSFKQLSKKLGIQKRSRQLHKSASENDRTKYSLPEMEELKDTFRRGNGRSWRLNCRRDLGERGS